MNPEFFFTQNESMRAFTQGFAGSVVGTLVAFGIMVALLVAVALYVYFALAWKTIATRLKYKRAWIAWIPLANIGMILQLGGFHWAWTFLILIPILGWIALIVLLVIAHWRIFEKLKYPGWLSIFMVIPQIGGVIYLVILGFVAWKKRH